MVGSLLLGLYDDEGTLHHVGIAASFTTERRKRARRRSSRRCARTRSTDHPWRDWAGQAEGAERRTGGCPAATSRWNRGKDLSWEPLRVERVCEVAYDHLQGDRFRHATQFLRWRPDRSPRACSYAQLEETPAYELSRIFGGEARAGGTTR